MKFSIAQLRCDALAIWQAGVDAVRAERLMREHIRVEGDWLRIGDDVLPLDEIDRIVVVGSGKAGAGMAAGLEEVLGERLLGEKDVRGWVNVPDDCARQLARIHLHAARPAGRNEPTEAAVAGTREILRLVASCGPRDLCLCLISGGGSALLVAPTPPVTLADKRDLTELLSAAGANIHQLNTVRKPLSLVKGGGLARTMPAGRMISLILSDVPGDPLDVIASGPTVENRATAQDALDVLSALVPDRRRIPPSVLEHLQLLAASGRAGGGPLDTGGIERVGTALDRSRGPTPTVQVANLVIGNLAAAVDAAGLAAVRLGYRPALTAATELEGPAEEVGRRLAEMALRMRAAAGQPDCLISGGEPTVQLVEPALRGRGGRNQQLVLAAAKEMGSTPGVILLSAGTDGEDGPTDAAGAFVDAEVMAAASADQLDMRNYLARNDAYHFFERTGGLIKTGPTHTNVCDLRVVLTPRNA